MASRDRDEISVTIGDSASYGPEWRWWTELDLTLNLDAYSTIALRAPFEPDREDFREVFRPFTFKPMRGLIGGERVFTGTMVDVFPSREPSERIVEVGGYALPGILHDCCEPATKVPLEFSKLGLRAIILALVDPFGLQVEAFKETNRFDRVKLEPDGVIQDFLVDLAKQRNLVISNTVDGKIRCWASVEPGNPVMGFEESVAPVGKVSASFSPQQCFSEITGYAGTKRGRKGSKSTVPNPFLRNILRPHSFTIDDTEPGGAPGATRAKLGRMFAEMASWTIPELPTWRDPLGKLWTPNTTILLKAPGAMVYDWTELLIRSVIFHDEAAKQYATLEVVLPGAFSGEVPQRLPWAG
jgi:prophage tail gpP-like protein